MTGFDQLNTLFFSLNIIFILSLEPFILSPEMYSNMDPVSGF